MTVLEAIQKSSEFLGKKGVDSPRLQSELLLAHVLSTERLKLYLDFTRVLNEPETNHFRELIKRRAGREPLQHILGSTSFCGIEVAVNRDVLIPRPETEQLAELGWKFLSSLGRSSTFLDFGTGSGCIALAICRNAPEAKGWALDQSAKALEVAQRNAESNQLAGRVRFIQSDGFAAIDPSLRFDLIISNPPYIPAGDIAALQEEVRDFDPRTALDGGADGLDFYRLLAGQAGHHLEPDGVLLAEFGDGQEAAIAGIFTDGGWIVDAVLEDFSGRPRMIRVRASKK